MADAERIPDNDRFIGLPDSLAALLLHEGPVWAVARVVAFRQRRRARAIYTNDPIDISLKDFQADTGMSKATISRAIEKARAATLIATEEGGGRGVKSRYSLAGILSQAETVSPGLPSHKLSQREATTVSSRVPHKEIRDSAQLSVGSPVLSKEGGPLQLAFDMLALGVPVYLHRWYTQSLVPDKEVLKGEVECLPDADGTGKLNRLFSTHPNGFALAVRIAHRPKPEVLTGREQASPTAHLPEGDWPITKVLHRFQDSGCELRRKTQHRWATRCPACNGPLFITARSNGKVSVKCQASNDDDEALRILGLTIRDLYPHELRAKVGAA
jgi:hypothetical protein